MLLRINGLFGGGKTRTAHEIARRLPGRYATSPCSPSASVRTA